MFDNPYSFLKLFGILIGIAFLIYRFQLIIMIIEDFKNWKKRKDKYEADKITFSQSSNASDELMSGNFPHLSNKITLHLHLLRIVNKNNVYFVYFSITGSPITILNIISNEIRLISIEPKMFIGSDCSGYFSFSRITPENYAIKLEIIFEDQNKVIHSKKYLLSISENYLTEVE